jgi:hypothetical protein
MQAPLAWWAADALPSKAVSQPEVHRATLREAERLRRWHRFEFVNLARSAAFCASNAFSFFASLSMVTAFGNMIPPSFNVVDETHSCAAPAAVKTAAAAATATASLHLARF